MGFKSIVAGMLFVVGLTAMLYYFDDSRDYTIPVTEEQIFFEESVYELLTEEEIIEIKSFAQRAFAAAGDIPTIYSPHAKYLDDGSLLAYMMFVNMTGEAVDELTSISIKITAGTGQTIAGGVFSNVNNMPIIPPNAAFVFSVIFNAEAVKNFDMNLSSYYTEVYFDYGAL